MKVDFGEYNINSQWTNTLELSNVLKEKILIVPSKINGLNFKRFLALSGYNLANVRMETLDNIAEELCRVELYKRNLIVPENVVLQSLMISVLKGLENSLKYFKVKITPETSEILSSAILELKMACFSDEMLINAISEDKFYNKEKAEDIKLIFAEYNRALTLNRYLDKAELYKIAIDKARSLSTKSNRIYIIPSNIKASVVERDFLEAITKGEFKVWNFQDIKNLNLPNSYFLKEKQIFNESKHNVNSALANLYSLEEIPEGEKLPKVRLIQAYGESNEVKEVLRRIKHSNTRLDEAVVFCSDISAYGQLYYDLSKKYEIPVTIEAGINIINSSIGRLFYGLIEWIESNYTLDILIRLLKNQYIKINSEDLLSEISIDGVQNDDITITNTGLVNIFTEISIGWGRERYISQLNKEIERLKENKRDNKLVITLGAKVFIEKVFKMIPDTESGNIDVDSSVFFNGLIHFVEQFGNTETLMHSLDVEAKESITHALKLLMVSHEVLPFEEITSQLRSVVEQINIGASEPRPGHLHITSFSSGIWIRRYNNFIVGLDSNRFPGVVHEDPILLDYERKGLCSGLMLKKDKATEKLYELGQLLLAIEGNITCSYSNFNLTEGKTIAPASVFLQLFRLVTKDFQADYSKLEKAFLSCGDVKEQGVLSRTCYIKDIDEGLDEMEFWVSAAHENEIKVSRDCVLKLYRALRHGQKAVNSRKSDTFTEYDGNISINLKEARFSSNKLESLAACPFGYFLEYILYIKEPKSTEVNRDKWLEAVDRGQLLHDVFEVFYREFSKTNEVLSFSAHRELIYKIAEGFIGEYRKELPPPNEVIFQREKKEIFNSCDVFLKSEESYFKAYKVKPKYFELGFGLKEKNDDVEALEGVTLELDGGKTVKLTGIIDRIDELEDGSFLIVDYKTGSPKNFENAVTMDNGRILQHAIYSFSAEKILEQKLNIKDAKVVKAIYSFPTTRGRGKIIVIEQEENIKNQRNSILKNLMGIIENGNFVMTENSQDCEYCGYNSICDREKYKQKLAIKLKDNNIKGIEFIRGLKNYE